ncbi:REH1 [Candida pseudojiufengensis]|uniref:REH1 n=1 Tax=Candida pseudojiufengensis TaxID=497109 RepID=UPI002224117F|nr:REH1 [Candida pseudojiufengensis]KAI5962598.1 REH1 [Candida pseudojiufengensis]
MSYLPSGSNPETSLFTCNTCSIKFVNADLQRQHMKTEWHRYNLKRRVAQLPSISSELFAEKILSSKFKSDFKSENEDEYGFYIATRKKKNNSRKQNLQISRNKTNFRGRPIERIMNEAKDTIAQERSLSPAGSVASELSQFSLNDSEGYCEIEPIHTGSELNYTESSDFTDYDDLQDFELEEEDTVHVPKEEDQNEETQSSQIPITTCFFCETKNFDSERNIRHMFNYHGLYIPERTFLSDVDGLLNHLSATISNFNCLVCGFQGKNLESIRQHIKSKGHCKIPYESKDEKLEFAKFYDFTTENEGKDASRKSKRSTKQSKQVAFIEDPSEPVSSSESLVDEEERFEDESSIDEQSTSNDERELNTNYSLVYIDSSGVELTTPIGSRIGHRSMHRYYRQNIALPGVDQDGKKTQALVDRRFSPGLTVREISKQQKESQKLENKIKSDHVRKMKPKKINYQRHFRDEILGT